VYHSILLTDHPGHHMKKLFRKLAVLSSIFFVNNAVPAQGITIKSPDGWIVFHLTKKDKQLQFAVTYQDRSVIQASPLVFSVNNETLTDHPVTGEVNKYSIHENYPWLGAHATAKNDCNGARINLSQNKTVYTLDVRVFNDGIGFRIVVPGTVSDKRVPDEAMVFNLPKGSFLWYHDFYMHYEGVHTKKEISQVQKGEWVAPPVCMQLLRKPI
jgi:alpha-glucosidase